MTAAITPSTASAAREQHLRWTAPPLKGPARDAWIDAKEQGDDERADEIARAHHIAEAQRRIIAMTQQLYGPIWSWLRMQVSPIFISASGQIESLPSPPLPPNLAAYKEEADRLIEQEAKRLGVTLAPTT